MEDLEFLEHWPVAVQRAREWVLECPADRVQEAAGYGLSVYQATDCVRQVLALTIYAVAVSVGGQVEDVTPAQVRDVLAGRKPGSVDRWWVEKLGTLVRYEPIAGALRQARTPWWDDSLSINGPGVAPHPVSHGLLAARAVFPDLPDPWESA